MVFAKLDDVLKAIEEKIGFSGGVMITEIQGHGKQKGLVQQWRGDQYRVNLLTKIKLEIVVKDVEVDKIKAAIVSAAKTGEIGDGKIFTYNINDVLRIRTGETGGSAIG